LEDIDARQYNATVLSTCKNNQVSCKLAPPLAEGPVRREKLEVVHEEEKLRERIPGTSVRSGYKIAESRSTFCKVRAAPVPEPKAVLELSGVCNPPAQLLSPTNKRDYACAAAPQA
jgi:hypothetical protein